MPEETKVSGQGPQSKLSQGQPSNQGKDNSSAKFEPSDELRVPKRSKTTKTPACVESMIAEKQFNQEEEKKNEKLAPLREMSRRSFDRWCLKKKYNLRLRKVVERQESEKDSWNLISNLKE